MRPRRGDEKLETADQASTVAPSGPYRELEKVERDIPGGSRIERELVQRHKAACSTPRIPSLPREVRRSREQDQLFHLPNFSSLFSSTSGCPLIDKLSPVQSIRCNLSRCGIVSHDIIALGLEFELIPSLCTPEPLTRLITVDPLS